MTASSETGRRSSSPPPGNRGPSAPSRTPNGRIYWDPNVLATELDRFFYRHWLCVGREEQIPGTGDFFTRTVGRESVLLVRDPDGGIRGFYNLCRHRGTRVVLEAEGKGAHSFICPYHAWSYGLDGNLIGALHMKGQVDFDRKDYGLHPVRVDTWGGFVWVNLEPTGPGLRESLGPFFARFDRFPLADLRLGGHQEYEVEANWKILVENFSECYHCAPVHPSLNRLTPYLSGDNDASFLDPKTRSLFSGGYMQFAQDFESMTRTGYTRRPRIPGMTAEDRKRVYYYVVFPNLFFSLHPDYLMVHRSWPTSPSHSRIENEFYFTPEAIAAPDFDPRDATDLWNEINLQDWKVCALAQEGMGSRAWNGGRYSDQEELVHDFDVFVTQELARPDPAPPRRTRAD
ncbi:MAG TPA: aromatic ring-hydroxylating dioxygenase subunit alpha [Thermoplasmata archaeon]|nr:aromatic ring-hydroxylating dioxygenase subunit alpha [Thermoplasmata archaeon]